MKPGATTRPCASIVRFAGSAPRPMAVIFPPAIETSARRAGAPVPSTTVPFFTRRSSTRALCSQRLQIHPHRLGADAAAHGLARLGGKAIVDARPDARVGRLPHVVLDARPLVHHARRGRRAEAEL